MLKTSLSTDRAANLYFNGKLKCKEIGDKLGITKQAVSEIIRKYVKRREIKFINTTIYKCKLCEIEYSIDEVYESNSIRNDINKVFYKNIICQDCKNSKIGKCGSCKSLYLNKKSNSKCPECNAKYMKIWARNNPERRNAIFNRWLNKNRDHYNELQRKYTKQKREKLNAMSKLRSEETS